MASKRSEAVAIAVAGGHYLAAGLLSRALPFLLLPVVSRQFNGDELGRLAIATSIASLLAAVGSFGVPSVVALWVAREPRLPGDRTPTHWSGLICAQTTAQVALAVVLWWTGPKWAAGFDGLAWDSALRMAIVLGLATSSLNVGQGVLRATGRSKAFVLTTMVQTVVSLPLAIAAAERWGPTGYVAGMAVGAAVAAMFAFGLALPAPRLSATALRSGAALGVPYVFHMAATWFLSMSDRVIIEREVGLEAVGVYFVAYSLGSGVLMVLQSAHGAWVPRFLAAPSVSGTSLIRTTRQATDAITVVMLAAVGLSPVLLHAFGARAFEDSVVVFALVAMSAVLLTPYHFAGALLLQEAKTRPLALATVVAAGSNIALNLVLVPVWGVRGAAFATAVSFTVQACATGLAARRLSSIAMPLVPHGSAMILSATAVGFIAVTADDSVWLGAVCVGVSVCALWRASVMWRVHSCPSSVVLFLTSSDAQTENAAHVIASLRETRGVLVDTTVVRAVARLPVGPVVRVGLRVLRALRAPCVGALVVPHDIGLVERFAVASARRHGIPVVLMPDGVAAAWVPMAGAVGMRGLINRCLEVTGVVAGTRGFWGSSEPDVVLSWGPGWDALWMNAAPRAHVRSVGLPRADGYAGMGRPEPGRVLVCSQPLWQVGASDEQVSDWYAWLRELVCLDDVRVRMHPLERQDTCRVPEDLVAQPVRPLTEDLEWASTVVSPFSTVLLEALAAGRQAVMARTGVDGAELGIPAFSDPRWPQLDPRHCGVAMREAGVLGVDRGPSASLGTDYLVAVGHASQDAATAIEELLHA